MRKEQLISNEEKPNELIRMFSELIKKLDPESQKKLDEIRKEILKLIKKVSESGKSEVNKCLDELRKKLLEAKKELVVILESPNKDTNGIEPNSAWQLFDKYILYCAGIAFDKRNRTLIENKKLSPEQIKKRALGKDFQSFKDARILDMYVLAGASPSMEIIYNPANKFLLRTSVYKMFINNGYYNGAATLSKYPNITLPNSNEPIHAAFLVATKTSSIPPQGLKKLTAEEIEQKLSEKICMTLLVHMWSKSTFLAKHATLTLLIKTEILLYILWLILTKATLT